MNDTAAPPVRVLLVDDDAQIRQLVCDDLNGFNIHADGVPDGRAMHAALAREDYQLILLDLMLPASDGFTLCRELRARTRIPNIMLTARSESADKVLGLELGADDYVVKPFDSRDPALIRTVRGESNVLDARVQRTCSALDAAASSPGCSRWCWARSC